MGEFPTIKKFDAVAHYVDLLPAYYDFTPGQIDKCRTLEFAPTLIVHDPSHSVRLVRGETNRDLLNKGFRFLGFIDGRSGNYSVTAWSNKS